MKQLQCYFLRVHESAEQDRIFIANDLLEFPLYRTLTLTFILKTSYVRWKYAVHLILSLNDFDSTQFDKFAFLKIST